MDDMTGDLEEAREELPQRVLEFSIEEFTSRNPGMNGALLVEHSRVALSVHHESPAHIEVCVGTDSRQAYVRFELPDARSIQTLQSREFTEKGAIVLAGLVLNFLEQKQITRVVDLGTRVDYFVGEHIGDTRWVMEVAGTNHGDLARLRRKKREQILKSSFLRAPHMKNGFVAVTRFGRPRCSSVIDKISNVGE